VRIAIIGWGSLIWNPDTLHVAEPFSCSGPELSIEFSRISPVLFSPPPVRQKFGRDVAERCSHTYLYTKRACLFPVAIKTG